MSLLEVKQRFVDGRPDLGCRLNLFQKFEAFFQEVLVSELVCDVWINGSFLTEKREPTDIDVAVIISSEFREFINQPQYDLVDRINIEFAYAPEIDVHAMQMLSKDDPNYDDELENPALTWHEQFGCETSKEWLKGFVALKVRETHVGLRICS